ncbi:stress protein [Streptomyces toyocaensis]|uniref:Stress protein n=1 Tax=Streptomyces toyocaensis TaxID=55952 RepID=A0A081XI18_STRTO|nr:universal stress protein [Streptomyces toyocaensis]KES03191.1 stress protein [Streptomyces toyocaensis]
MLSPVVAGVDGSAGSLVAAAWAAHEAVRRGRALRLLHAREGRSRRGEPPIADAARRTLAQRVLRQAEERVLAACPGVRLYDDQVEWPATDALVRAAEDADLLVLGSRGAGRLTGLLAGSVALGVVARATHPVVLVRADTDEDVLGRADSEEGRPAGPPRDGRRDVVLGLDVTGPCDEVIAFAFEAARLRRARLRVLHAWRAPGPFPLGPGEAGLPGDPRRAGEWLGFLSSVLRVWRDKYPDVVVLEMAVEGRPSDALLRAASAADLLVVGHRLTDRPRVPRTGPVAHAVMQQAGCAVAVVPHF